jgi:cytoskeletal protein RodZ
MKAGCVTVGETLSHARRERGLSVDDVAAGTRIRATLVRAIEADDFRLCGGTVYARGHIRSMARVVGIDPEPLIAQFDAAHQVEAPKVEAAAQTTDHNLISRVSRTERRPPNWVLAGAAAAVVVIVLALVLLPVLFGHSGGHKAPLTAPQHSTAPRTTAKPKPSASSRSTPALPQAASGATMLVRTARGETWLSIKTKTGKTLYEGLLAAGQQKVFKSRYALAFVIGDAPAVDVVVNGHDIGSPPSSGNVSRGSVVPGANTVHQA